MGIRFKFKLHLLLIAFVLSLSSHADDSQLDNLFLKLKNASNESSARQYEHSIWNQWFQSGDQHIDSLMQTALNKRKGYDFNGALDVLNEIILLKPDYPEAWNQRATVYFHQTEYEKSLWNIAKTLELEPRHFGAMAGRAVIRLYQSKPALARQNIIQAIEVHPYLKERGFFPGL